jgi:nucleoid DNA-binding protein
MMNARLEKIINKVAKDLDEDPVVVGEMVDTVYKTISEVMKDYRYPEVNLVYFGIFRARCTYVERMIEKLQYKLHSHSNPELITEKIMILTNTTKRIRYEYRRRQRKLAPTLVGNPK